MPGDPLAQYILSVATTDSSLGTMASGSEPEPVRGVSSQAWSSEFDTQNPHDRENFLLCMGGLNLLFPQPSYIPARSYTSQQLGTIKKNFNYLLKIFFYL